MLILCGALATMFLLLNGPVIAVAYTNGQSPNEQILSSSTSTDNLSFVRQSMYTGSQFHISDDAGDGFTYQMNAYVNGGSSGCDCAFMWVLQGIVTISSSSGGTKGAFVTGQDIEDWDGSSTYFICSGTPSTPPNINNTDYLVYQQDTLNTTTAITRIVNVMDSSNNLLYAYHQTCNYDVAPVDYYNQVEGVIVGPADSHHTKFTPLNTASMFYGYIDLVSNYNHLSDSSKPTLTLETSNLYQKVAGTTSESYGIGYLYSVSMDENTTGAS